MASAARSCARAGHLIQEGQAQRQGKRILSERDLLAAETGLAHQRSETGEYATGGYRQRLVLSSGRRAMIEIITGNGGLGGQLVPWVSSLEKKRSQSVSGIFRDDGSTDWTFGRKRGWYSWRLSAVAYPSFG